MEPHNVTFTFAEANQVLNTLRSIQMNLGAVYQAVTEAQRTELALLSPDMAGALMSAVDLVEQTIFESGVSGINSEALTGPPPAPWPEPSPN